MYTAAVVVSHWQASIPVTTTRSQQPRNRFKKQQNQRPSIEIKLIDYCDGGHIAVVVLEIIRNSSSTVSALAFALLRQSVWLWCPAAVIVRPVLTTTISKHSAWLWGKNMETAHTTHTQLDRMESIVIWLGATQRSSDGRRNKQNSTAQQAETWALTMNSTSTGPGHLFFHLSVENWKGKRRACFFPSILHQNYAGCWDEHFHTRIVIEIWNFMKSYKIFVIISNDSDDLECFSGFFFTKSQNDNKISHLNFTLWLVKTGENYPAGPGRPPTELERTTEGHKHNF